MREDLLIRMQNDVAERAVGPSALRNQGGPGVVAATRNSLKAADLARWSVRSRRAFAALLDAETDRLKKRLPRGAQNWGAARKALNLFLRDVIYHRVLCRTYRLGQLEPWLEVPLDSYVAEAIRRELPNANLPKWPGVKYLEPEVSIVFQAAAASLAAKERTARVHLDFRWWSELAGR